MFDSGDSTDLKTQVVKMGAHPNLLALGLHLAGGAQGVRRGRLELVG